MSTIILLTVVEVRKVLEAKFPSWRGTAESGAALAGQGEYSKANKAEEHYQEAKAKADQCCHEEDSRSE